MIIRLLILVALAILTYSTIKFLFHPRRKLEQAHERNQFFFFDEKDIRKNILLTYKGVMFEGEKLLGTTDQSFEIVSIKVWARRTDQLTGFSKDDFQFIADDIHLRYPNAKIEWKSPIRELLGKEQRE
ncbi:sigma-w pathway protein ysdB [bacterium LRH843]|nr:sigma-w pathway protein ysdB [bacterium LRH843]